MNKQRKREVTDIKSRIIKRQSDQIDLLEQKINELEVGQDKKDEIINSIEPLKKELSDIVDELKSKSKEYDKIIADLMNMRKVMNEEFFKGRWRLIKFLLK